jgi:hypothetical protein
VLIDSYCFSVEALDIFYFYFIDFLKNGFLPLDCKLLVMWEGIGEALLIVFEVLLTV